MAIAEAIEHNTTLSSFTLNASFTQMVTSLFVAYVVLRELRRLGIEPDDEELQFKRGGMQLAEFRRLCRVGNPAVARSVSMYDALYGDSEIFMHCHNIPVRDDQLYHAVLREVNK